MTVTSLHPCSGDRRQWALRSSATVAAFFITAVVAIALAPSAVWASSDAHAVIIPWKSIGFHAFNLGVLLIALVFFLRRPLSDALKNRSVEVRRAIEDAQGARDEAQRQIAELEDKLAHFADEVAKMRQEVKAEADNESRLFAERAEKEAAAIRISAERAIRDETRRARRVLQEETVRLAIQLAEETLRREVSPHDHRQLARDLLVAIEQNRASLEV